LLHEKGHNLSYELYALHELFNFEQDKLPPALADGLIIQIHGL